jgi:hypothetical protein
VILTVAAGFALPVAVLFDVVLVLTVAVLPGVVPEPTPQAARAGIRKSIRRRAEPVPVCFLSHEAFSMMMYPSLKQRIDHRKERICETDFLRE